MELLNDKGSSRRGSSNSNFSEICPALCQLCSMSLWLLFTVDVTRDPQALNESRQRAPAKAGSLAVDALCLASGTNTHALRLLCTQHSCQTQAWRHRFPTRSRLDSGFDQTLTECKELQAYVTLLSSLAQPRAFMAESGEKLCTACRQEVDEAPPRSRAKDDKSCKRGFGRISLLSLHVSRFKLEAPATSFGPACRAGVHRTAPRTNTAVAA